MAGTEPSFETDNCQFLHSPRLSVQLLLFSRQAFVSSQVTIGAKSGEAVTSRQLLLERLIISGARVYLCLGLLRLLFCSAVGSSDRIPLKFFGNLYRIQLSDVMWHFVAASLSLLPGKPERNPPHSRLNARNEFIVAFGMRGGCDRPNILIILSLRCRKHFLKRRSPLQNTKTLIQHQRLLI